MTLNLFQYLFLLFVVAITAFGITPIFRRIARVAKLLDYPGGRKLQASPVAYLGGLAVAAPITLGSLLVVFTSISSDIKNQFFLGLILPALAIAFIGLLDDLYQLPPWPRFIAQCGVGVISSLMLYLSDGGVISNYPLFVLPDEEHSKTLSILIRTCIEKEENLMDMSIEELIRRPVSIVLTERTNIETRFYDALCIQIDLGNLNILEFSLDVKFICERIRKNKIT